MDSKFRNGIKFREARKTDTSDIHNLYLTLTEDENVKVLPARVESIASDANNFLYVLELDEVILGTCFLTFCLDPMYSEQPFAVLENIIVSPKVRNQGMGAFMLSCIERICSQKDCTKIMLQSSSSRLEAHDFFETAGYSKSKKIGFTKYHSDFEAS